jgi:hypothetical protein
VIDSAPDSRLSQFERLTLLGGRELDRALEWITSRTSSFSLVNSLDQNNQKIDVDAIIGDAKFYSANPAWADDYTSFYKKPEVLPNVGSKLIHGLKDGGIIDLTFTSSYLPQNAAYSEFNERYVENKTVHARYWQHTEKAKATIIALHGWTMGDQRLNSLAFLPGHFYKLGFDVMLVELPFHGRRRPKELTQEQADSLFPGSNLAFTNEVIGQFIHDLRQLKMFLNIHGTKKAGCIGMSLGAYFASLWAMLDELDFCIPIVPVSSMSEIAWRALKNIPSFLELKKQGLTREILDMGFAIHCPLSFKPKTKPGNVMILAGLADKIVPSSQPRALWKHWNKPSMHWFRGGHLLQFKSRRALTQISKFLKAL